MVVLTFISLLRRRVVAGVKRRVNTPALLYCSSSLDDPARVRQRAAAPPRRRSSPSEGREDKVLQGAAVRSIIKTYLEKKDLNSLVRILNMCATGAVFEPPSEKAVLGKHVFDSTLEYGVQASTFLFHALLQVYNANNHHFDPAEVLNDMMSHGLKPEAKTYQLLIDSYCNSGQVGRAIKLLEVMKSSNLVVGETVWESLVTGYSRQGRLSKAEGLVDRLKSGVDGSHDSVYCRLMSAYIEHGLLDKMNKMLEEVHPLSSTHSYLVVMDTLSRCGHGEAVADILSLIKSDTSLFMMIELRYLCYTCLSRGELEAPQKILQHLSETNGVNYTVIKKYFSAAMKLEESIHLILQLLNTLVDLSAFPMLPLIVSEKVVLSHTADLPSGLHRYPERNELKPHPWGRRWVTDTRSVLKWIHRSLNRSYLYYYYPLLARHCSDGNIEDMIETFHLMMSTFCMTDEVVNGYIKTTYDNADSTIQEFYDVQTSTECTDSWLEKLLVFQISQGHFPAATATAKRLKNTELLISNSITVYYAVVSANKYHRNKEGFQDLCVALVTSGAPLKRVAPRYFLKGKLNVQLFYELMKNDVTVSWDDVMFCYFKTLTRQVLEYDTNIPLQVWDMMKKYKYVPCAEVLKHYYQYFTRISTLYYKELDAIYEQLPQTMKESYNTKCDRIFHLMKINHNEEAVQKFQELMDGGNQPIPALLQKRALSSAFKVHPDMGKKLLSRLEARGYVADEDVRVNIAINLAKHRDLTATEDIFYKLKGWNNKLEVYSHLIRMWAELGETGRIRQVESTRDAAALRHELNQAMVVALVVNGEVEEAFAQIQTLKGYQRDYLVSLVDVLISKDCDLTRWKDYFKSIGLLECATNTNIFVSFLNCGRHDEAREMIGAGTRLNKSELAVRLALEQPEKYQDLLDSWGVKYVDYEKVPGVALSETEVIGCTTDAELSLKQDDKAI